MPRGESISSLCTSRLLQTREEAKNDSRKKSDAIGRSAAPLLDVDARRPFMIPRYHSPHDVWHLIMDEITDPQEILMLWELSPVFREILANGSKYIQARLPQIIQIILTKRPWFLLDSQWRYDNLYLGTITTSPTSIILGFRMVSRICKKSLEGLPKATKVGKIHIYLQEVDQVERIIDDILQNDCSPDSFLLRALFVDEVFLNEDEAEIFYGAIQVLLSLVGNGVRKLHYKSFHGSPQDIYDNLRNMVTNMPNLEHLELTSYFIELDEVEISDFEDLEPFPMCPQLQSITLAGGRYLPEVILRRIVESCPSIKTWKALPKYDKRSLRGLIDPSEMNVKLHDLEFLQIPIHASLLRSLELQLPLKCIIFLDPETGRKFKTSTVFKFLNQFKDTLEHLELMVGIDHSGNCFLNLPRLKTIEWQCKESFRDMRFLLHAGCLEEIKATVFHRTFNPKYFSEWFFSSVKKAFDGFSMWQVFPRLGKMELRFPLKKFDGKIPTLTYKRNV